jgi:protoheme IX farnesyltransferase
VRVATLPRIACTPWLSTLAAPTPRRTRWAQYYALTKPRVVQLIVFCAVIGMLLAEPGCPIWPGLALAGTAGIWLVASAAAAFNCLVEQHIDAAWRAPPGGPRAKGS